jgi:glyoxylase-like metal-dependent hydrolase (beta-lactamase superfamily II)
MIKMATRLIISGLFLGLFCAACSITKEDLNQEHAENVFAFSVQMANIFLVKSGDDYVMIDSGYEGDEAKIEKKLSGLQINPKQIKYLIITHAHADHAGNAAYFKEKYGFKIIVGEADSTQLANGENGAICPTSFSAGIFKWFAPKQFPAVLADVLVRDSLNMQELGFPLKIFHIGGHTPGSVFISYKDIIFIGDQIKGGTFNPDNVRRHFYICNLQENNRDIKTVLTKHPSKYWLPGHFGVLETAEVLKWLEKQE